MNSLQVSSLRSVRTVAFGCDEITEPISLLALPNIDWELFGREFDVFVFEFTKRILATHLPVATASEGSLSGGTKTGQPVTLLDGAASQPTHPSALVYVTEDGVPIPLSMRTSISAPHGGGGAGSSVSNGCAAERGLSASLRAAMTLLEFKDLVYLVDAFALVFSGECRNHRSVVVVHSNSSELLSDCDNTAVHHFQPLRRATSSTLGDSGISLHTRRVSICRQPGIQGDCIQRDVVSIVAAPILSQPVELQERASSLRIRRGTAKITISNSDNLTDQQLQHLQQQLRQQRAYTGKSYTNPMLISMSRRSSSTSVAGGLNHRGSLNSHQQCCRRQLSLSAPIVHTSKTDFATFNVQQQPQPHPIMTRTSPLSSGEGGGGSDGGSTTQQRLVEEQQRAQGLHACHELSSRLQSFTQHEVILTLCTVFAHMHLAYEDFVDFAALFADTLRDVQASITTGSKEKRGTHSDTPLPVSSVGGADILQGLHDVVKPHYESIQSVLSHAAGNKCPPPARTATASGEVVTSAGPARPNAQSPTSANGVLSVSCVGDASPLQPQPPYRRPLGSSYASNTDVRYSQAGIYYREQCGILRGGTSSTCSSCPRAPLNEVLVRDSTYVLHYAVTTSMGATTASTKQPQAEKFVWRLGTRLVSLRGHYVYVYDGVATTLTFLGEDASALARGEHNTPIAVIDTARLDGGDLVILSGSTDTHVIDINPVKEPLVLDKSRHPDDQEGVHSVGGIRRHNQFDKLETICLLAEGGDVFALTLPTSCIPACEQFIATAGAFTAPCPRRSGGINKDPMNRGSSRESSATCLLHRHHGSRLREYGRPVRMVTYPLKVRYRGVIHNFLFQSPNVRGHWYKHFSVLLTTLQSAQHVEKVARAPKCVTAFITNRLSLPAGPSALEYLCVLGTGAYGRVLLVRHKLSGQLFAMKVFRKGCFQSLRSIIEVRRERRILESADCPYILKMHSVFQTESRVYILMNYLSGGELLFHTLKARDRCFSEELARFFVAELAIAVEYLRLRGIMHRDIKGDNLILDGEGHLVLADFGFAKRITLETGSIGALHGAESTLLGRTRRQHTTCGTVAYIAPEVASNTYSHTGYGLEADWWSMGVVLFTMVTGFFPFLRRTNEETMQAITTSPLTFPVQPALSQEVKEVLLSLLERNPAKRVSTLEQLKALPFFRGFDWEACAERRLAPPVLLHRDRYSHGQHEAERAWEPVPTEAGASLPLMPPFRSPHTSRCQKEFREECEELRLVEEAYGVDADPAPLHPESDVFGPLYEHQEVLGSDRDVEDDFMDDYIVAPRTESLATTPVSRYSGLTRGAPTGFATLQRSPIDFLNDSLSVGTPGRDENGFPRGTRGVDENEDDLVPILSDFQEVAYTSFTQVRPTQAELASISGFYRPVYRD